MDVDIVGTLGLVYAGFTVLAAAAAVSIVRKAGYSAWWVATAVVPLANLVMLFAFAFADWPALREGRRAAPVTLSASGHPSFAPAGYPQAGYSEPAQPQPAYPQPAQPQPAYPQQAAQPQSAYPQQAAQQVAQRPVPEQFRPRYNPLYPPPGE